MLLSLFLLFYAFILSHLIGVNGCAILNKWLDIKPYHKPQTGLSNLIGLAIMSPFIAVYHFFFKIDFILHLFFIAWAFGNITYLKNELKLLWDEVVQAKYHYLILVLASLLSIAVRPGTGDIADYHLQAIKWAENYQNIIGLGSFNRPLANNNWWFNMQAFLGFSWLGVQSVYVGNALLFICAILIFTYGKPVNRAHTLIRFVFAAFTFLTIKTAFIGSVTPDIVVTLFVFIIIDFYFRILENPEEQKAILLIMMLLISWILTVKATSILLFVIPLPIIVQVYFNKENWKGLFGLLALVSAFIIPWVMGNVIACGYLLYPFNQIDLFNVDWKVPAHFFEFDKMVISNWGKIPEQDIYLTQTYSISQWLPVWFSKLDLFNKSLVIIYLISVPVLLFRCIKQREYLWPFLFLQLGFVTIFLNGPHLRFLFPYMVSTFALLIGSMERFIKFKLPLIALWSLAVILCLLLIFKLYNRSELLSSILKPKPYPTVILEEKNINNFPVYITKNNNSCWDRFPCSYYFIDSVALRGPDITSGFRIKP